MGKFKASKIIVSESWKVLKQDKEMILFPLLSMLFSLAPLILFFIYYFFIVLGGSLSNFNGLNENISDYAFLFYLIYAAFVIFIINFFEAGVFVMSNARFDGQNVSFSEALKISFRNTGKILVWSLFSATVGYVLNIIADRLKIMGKIVTWIFGAAWNIMTYFVLPSIIVGQNSIRNSLSDSASIIKKNWGETVIINLGVGVFFSVIFYIYIVCGYILLATLPQFMFVTLPVVLIGLVGIIVISSTLSSIFKVALYKYASTGVVPREFSEEVIKGAISSK